MAAREALEKDGIATAVVSIPCWEILDQQDEAYQEDVLGRNVVRVAIEAGVRMGWEKYIGDQGGFVGMSGFGASAPAEQLFEHFEITFENVVEQVKARL